MSKPQNKNIIIEAYQPLDVVVVFSLNFFRLQTFFSRYNKNNNHFKSLEQPMLTHCSTIDTGGDNVAILGQEVLFTVINPLILGAWHHYNTLFLWK